MPSENKGLRALRVKISDAMTALELKKAEVATAESYLALLKGVESDLTAAYQTPKPKRKGPGMDPSVLERKV